METTLTPEEQADVLSDLDEERMKAEIQKAEQEADILLSCLRWESSTSGADRRAKRTLHKMVHWGAG